MPDRTHNNKGGEGGEGPKNYGGTTSRHDSEADMEERGAKRGCRKGRNGGKGGKTGERARPGQEGAHA